MSLSNTSKRDPGDDALHFTSRPARAKTCSRCRGHGSVAVPYALRHVEDAALSAAAGGALTACVAGSSNIFECCREAAEVAGRARQPVAFQFNGRVVVVNMGDDPVAVARLWWQETYGETPEKTRAKR